MPHLRNFIVGTLAILWFSFNWGLPSAIAAGPPSFGYADLVGQDFSGQLLQRAVFAKAHLEDVTLRDANLVGAVLTGATTKRTSFQNANLTDAMLDQMTLIDTNFSDAILVGAIFLRSDFEHINITGADFTDAIFDGSQIKKLCKVASGVNSHTGVDTRESLGCLG